MKELGFKRFKRFKTVKDEISDVTVENKGCSAPNFRQKPHKDIGVQSLAYLEG